jgi:glycosyltransferase involved in cell wall biosynthesis
MPVRRIAYPGLGAVLLTGLATLSWLVIDITLVVALLVLGWEARDLRIRLGRQQQRAAAAQELLAEQGRLQAGLATELYDQSMLLGREFPAELGPLVLGNLIARGDVLDAYLLAGDGGLAALPPDLLRRLRDELRRRGYYDWALTVAERVTGTEPDRRVPAMLRGEIAVTTGTFTPVVPDSAPDGAPVPGRVLHLVGTSLPASPAGHPLRTHHLVTAQRAAGLDPRVVTHTGFAPESGPVEVLDGIAYHRPAGPAVRSVPLDEWLAVHVANVAALVRALRPAVLHAAPDFRNALTAEAIGAAYGIPVVYESHAFPEETYLSGQLQRYGWDPETHAERYGLPDFYLRRRDAEDRVRRDADRVVTPAAAMADRIAAGGVARDRIAVLPNAVDAAAFPVVTRDAALAARYGIDPEATVIGHLGSIAEYTGIDTLIGAYAAVKAAARGPVALLIVGDGPGREDLERLAAALPDTHFTGEVPHHAIVGYYSLIDIFVVPSRPAEVCHLVTPLTPYEAFATGRTVVLSDVRALAAIARESGAAELFAAGDAESLAGVLLTLLGDPRRCAELAATGAAWVRAERTWAANARLYLALYAELRAIEVPRQVTGSGKAPATERAVGRTSP